MSVCVCFFLKKISLGWKNKTVSSYIRLFDFYFTSNHCHLITSQKKTDPTEMSFDAYTCEERECCP